MILALAAIPALAQPSTTPGSLGGDQVGTGAVEPQGGSGGSGSASANTATTNTPMTGPATASPATTAGSQTAGSMATPGSTTTTGSSSSSGGGHGGGTAALCLSAKGSVTSVDPDAFGLDCSQ